MSEDGLGARATPSRQPVVGQRLVNLSVSGVWESPIDDSSTVQGWSESASRCGRVEERVMAEQEPDITNFSTPSTHRLPTVSATQALEIAAQRTKRTPTGLSGLDDILRADNGASKNGGIPRAQVTEIYGPPGVGKTALALQIAVNAIHGYDDQNDVVWVNTGAPLLPGRVKSFIAGYRLPPGQEPPSSPPQPRSKTNMLNQFDCINALTLPRLLTLFLYPTAAFPPPKATLIIVDDMSNLIHGSFPKTSGKVASVPPSALREKQAQKAAGRKWSILADLATAMSRMAVLRNVAILVVSQTATSLNRGEKARLRPALTGPPWNLAVQNRILLYRDFLLPDSAEGLPPSITHQVRFAEVVKVNGKEREYGYDPTTFVIRKGGIKEINLQNKHVRQQPPSEPELNGPMKRKADEIADSEEEDGEVGSDDDLGSPAEEDDSDVEMLGDNRTRPPVVTASQQPAYENNERHEEHERCHDEEEVSLPVRASPRKSHVLLKGSEDYLTQADDEDDDDEEPLTGSDTLEDERTV